MNTSELTESTLMIIARLRTENEALKSKHTEPDQEPEPVAWMWQSDNYATRFSQRIFELFDEADDMRNRHGGNLYPLYFEASPNAKRIAELESRINNGVRVYAHQDRIDGFTAATNRDLSYSGKMKANATLLLDEQGD